MFSSDKVLTCNQPLYHSHLLASYTPACTVRSQDKCLLTVPAVSPITGGQGFSYAAPSVGMYRIVNFTIRPVPDSECAIQPEPEPDSRKVCGQAA